MFQNYDYQKQPLNQIPTPVGYANAPIPESTIHGLVEQIGNFAQELERDLQQIKYSLTGESESQPPSVGAQDKPYSLAQKLAIVSDVLSLATTHKIRICNKLGV